MARPTVTSFLRTFEDVGSTFFDLERDILIVLDDKGNIERVNPEFERSLGYAERDVLGQGMIRIVMIDDWAEFLRSFTSVNPSIIRFLKKKSGTVSVRLIAFRFRNEHGYLVFRRYGSKRAD